MTFPEDLIDASETRELLAEAQKLGITDRDLEKLSGISRESFSRVRLAKSPRIKRITANRIAEALSNMDIAERHPMTLVDATWTHQMVLSLVAQGWTMQHQRDIILNNRGEKAGFIRSRSSYMPEKVYYKNVQTMRWLVRALGDGQGPAKATAKKMQKRGIFPVKHYNYRGDLIPQTLTKEQRAFLESV